MSILSKLSVTLPALYPFVKVVLLSGQLVADRNALTPPNDGPNKDEKDLFRATGASEVVSPNFLIYGGNILKFILYGLASSEMALVIGTTFPRILTYFPESIASHLFNAGRNVRLSIPFCVGYTLVSAGATIRVLCYRRLRDRFTFDLAIRKDHALETGGMYSVVRHPAYIGSLLFIGGTYICACDGQSLLAAFGVWETSWGKAFHSFMVGSALLAVYVFVDRTRVEDRALQQQFGEQWVTWARRTPYKLIPFVF